MDVGGEEETLTFYSATSASPETKCSFVCLVCCLSAMENKKKSVKRRLKWTWGGWSDLVIFVTLLCVWFYNKRLLLTYRGLALAAAPLHSQLHEFNIWRYVKTRRLSGASLLPKWAQLFSTAGTYWPTGRDVLNCTCEFVTWTPWQVITSKTPGGLWVFILACTLPQGVVAKPAWFWLCADLLHSWCWAGRLETTRPWRFFAK